MNLILDSHPNIMSIDEDKFDYISLNTYLHGQWLPEYTSFKLPRYAPILSFLKSFKDFKILWCIRDPMDVVLSMVKLQIATDKNKTNTVSWTAHPNCAQREILNSYLVLGDTVKRGLTEEMKKCQLISSKNPQDRNRQENIFMGALCWRVKNELPSLYQSEYINFHVVKYESLVTETESTIKGALDYIGVGWSDDVLRHHETHKGTSIGNTSNTRPIDSSGVGRGVNSFIDEEVDLIKRVCGKTAEAFAY